MLCLRFLVSVALLDVVVCELIAAAVIPHGDFAFDPSLIRNQNGSLKLHHAAKETARWIASLKPDLILMTTPHGLADSKDFLLYANTLGKGSAHLGEDLENNCTHGEVPLSYDIHLSVKLAPNQAKALQTSLNEVDNLSSSSLLAFGDVVPIPLQWGEVIPLTYVKDYLSKSQCQTLIISIPTKRFTQSQAMIPELLLLGQSIYAYAESTPQRVLILISADLAHTHEACGPYGYTPAAQPFDEACGKWAQNLNGAELLTKAGNLVGEALSCGYTGLVMLHGALSATGSTNMWNPKLLALEPNLLWNDGGYFQQEKLRFIWKNLPLQLGISW